MWRKPPATAIPFTYIYRASPRPYQASGVMRRPPTHSESVAKAGPAGVLKTFLSPGGSLGGRDCELSEYAISDPRRVPPLDRIHRKASDQSGEV